MSEVKWIKITTDIFDDEKILLIENMPEADSIIVIWFKLLCLAGKQNNSGVFMLNDTLAYTDDMLSTIFRRKKTTVTMALEVFEKFGMIETINGVITIPKWGKHQNTEGIDKVREQTRLRVARYRENQKQLSCNATYNATVTESNAPEKSREEEKRIELDTLVNNFLDSYSNICVSFPKVRVLTDKRKKAIQKLFKKFSEEEIKTVLIKAEESDFLTGRSKDWSANLDWILNENNFVKILEGRYDNRKAENNKKFAEYGVKSVQVTDEEIANGYFVEGELV